METRTKTAHRVRPKSISVTQMPTRSKASETPAKQNPIAEWTSLSVEPSDPRIEVRHYPAPIRQCVGAAHAIPNGQPGETPCILCVSSIGASDPFLVDCKNLEAERDAIANFVASDASVVPDALTWLTARCDWERSARVKHYFCNNYDVIREACDDVNRLPTFELDGSKLEAWSASAFSDEASRPSYCSWCYVPREAKHITRVFYVRTHMPSDEDIFQYLSTVLHPPTEFIKSITKRENEIKGTVAFNAESRLERRLSFHNRLTSSNLPATRNGADPRRERADNLDKRVKLKQQFTGLTPRLMFLPVSGSVQRLEPRPDSRLHAGSSLPRQCAAGAPGFC